jgi:hypothetical protein
MAPALPASRGAPFRRSSVLPELILFGRRVPVDVHRAGGGRNRAEPVTRHRNTGGCSERVAHFLCDLRDPLWLCREHYVLARISSKCRCAKCEREHDTCASNRRTAQATDPDSVSNFAQAYLRLFETICRSFSGSVIPANTTSVRSVAADENSRLPTPTRSARHSASDVNASNFSKQGIGEALKEAMTAQLKNQITCRGY